MKKIATLLMLVISVATFAQNGLDFDGVNDHVYATTGGPTGSSSRTVECWIKTSTNISTQQVLVDWGSTIPNGSRFTMNVIYNGKLRIEVGGNGFHGTTNIADGIWHHVAVTYDNAAVTKFKLYVDGALEATQNTTVAVNTSTTGGFQIGRRVDGINYFDGIIDEVRVWSTVRTAAEILASMNGEFCVPPTGLVAYYKMNQGTAGGTNTGITTLTNALGSNNGTLSGFALSGSSSNWVIGKSLTSGGPTTGNATLTVCDSYTASNGTVWTTNGNYVDTLTSAAGCDSILNIALTVNNSSSGSLTTSACNKYTSPSGNNTWTTSGTYSDVLLNSEGCDSVLTINLTINTIDTNVLVNGAYLTAYAAGATYQWLDCANGFASISGATNQTYQATANGSYAVEVSKNGCTDTSACFAVNNIGMDELSFAKQIQVFPNPASDKVNFKLGQTYKTVALEFVDATGTIVLKSRASNTSSIDLPLSLPTGLYFVKISADNFRTVKKLSVH